MRLPPAVVPCSVVVYTARTTVVTIERIVPCAVAVPVVRIIILRSVVAIPVILLVPCAVAVPVARIIILSTVAHNIAQTAILVVCVIAFISEHHLFISPSQYVYVYRHACKSFDRNTMRRDRSEL